VRVGIRRVMVVIAVLAPLAAAMVAAAAATHARRSCAWSNVASAPSMPPRATSSLTRQDAILLFGACGMGWLVARAIGVLVGLSLAWVIQGARQQRTHRR